METINSAGAFICLALLAATSLKQGNGVTAESSSSSSANSISSSYSTDTSVTSDLKATESAKSDSGVGDNTQSAAATSTLISDSSEMSLERTSTAAKSAESTTESGTEEFHVILIVMIAVLGFVVFFSVLCGVLTLCGVDIGCPLPCCGGGGGSNRTSQSGIPLKTSSKRSRNLSSQRLNEAAEEPQEFDFGSSVKTDEPETHYNEGYNVYYYEEEATAAAAPAFASSSKITLSQEEPMSVNL